jgi:hemolysin III
MIKRHLSELSVEELANTLTHGVGLILSIAGFAVLIALATLRSDPLFTVSALVYGTSLVVLYAASTFYHSTISETRKGFLQLVDHCCIYLLIAGSYTPFLLTVLHGTFAFTLLVIVWSLAAVGIAMKVIFRGRFDAVGIVMYLSMGWLGLAAVQPLYLALGAMPILLVVAGGISYSLGMIFFGWKSIRHHHAIFHVFVLCGSILHYAAVILYVVPPA